MFSCEARPNHPQSIPQWKRAPTFHNWSCFCRFPTNHWLLHYAKSQICFALTFVACDSWLAEEISTNYSCEQATSICYSHSGKTVSKLTLRKLLGGVLVDFHGRVNTCLGPNRSEQSLNLTTVYCFKSGQGKTSWRSAYGHFRGCTDTILVWTEASWAWASRQSWWRYPSDSEVRLRVGSGLAAKHQQRKKRKRKKIIKKPPAKKTEARAALEHYTWSSLTVEWLPGGGGGGAEELGPVG